MSGGRRALDSTVLNDAVANQDTITKLAECLFGKQTATGLGGFAIHESDGAPDEKERRPTDGRRRHGEMWPRRQETFSCLTQAHRAVPS